MIIPDRYRLLCRILRILSLVLFAGLAFMFVWGAWYFTFVWRPYLPSGSTVFPGMPDVSNLTLIYKVSMFHLLGYLWALWAVQRAFGELAGGRLFHPVVARAMRQTGAGILAATLFNLLVLSTLNFILVGWRFGYAHINLQTILLAIVAALLIGFARVVDQAQAMQTELEEFV